MQEQGPMQSWSSSLSSNGGGRKLHPPRGNALIKSYLKQHFYLTIIPRARMGSES